MTPLEMARFIKANRKRQLDDYKMLAQVGYSGGCIGSMAFAKRRPGFNEVFKFPEEEKDEHFDVDASKAQMLALAETINRSSRRSKKGGK